LAGRSRRPVPENTAVQAAPVAQTAPETVALKAETIINGLSLRSLVVEVMTDPRKKVIQFLHRFRRWAWIVEQLTAGQDQIAREMRLEMARLEFDLVNILLKIPEPPPQRRGRR
jgi:hypothetical protein